MKDKIYQLITRQAEAARKGLAVLVDPDKYDDDRLLDLIDLSERSGVFCFFVGGSLMTSDRFAATIAIIKAASSLPVIIFPGSNLQIDGRADALLLLSLISGRNPEYLIGQHVVAAPYLKKSGLECLPTGYMLIGDTPHTTAHYMSNSYPIPSSKDEIAVCTALAGEMLGMKLIYMDGGSGANQPIPTTMIRAVKEQLSVPLIAGGGVNSAKEAKHLWEAGADIVVVGNALEKNPGLVQEISGQLKSRI